MINALVPFYTILTNSIVIFLAFTASFRHFIQEIFGYFEYFLQKSMKNFVDHTHIEIVLPGVSVILWNEDLLRQLYIQCVK